MVHFRAAVSTALMLLCASCGGGSGDDVASSEQVALRGKPNKLLPLPSATPTPTPTPAPTPTASALDGLVQLDSIPSNFDTAAELVPMELPQSMAPDDVGAFRMTCAPSHNAYDDPIVYPGQPGAAHLHTFFGNTKTDAYSTYASLRTTGDSTCHTKLNRSAYWVPAMMNGLGKVVMPDYVSIYYKRFPSSSAMCRQVGTCVPLPRGLRMVFGRKMTGEEYAGFYERAFNHFSCDTVSGGFKTLAEAAKNCPSGSRLGAVLLAPPCWNGTQLDSADHRSHLAWYAQDAQGLIRCPSTHPYVIPFFQLGAWYTTDDTLDRSGSEDPAQQTWHFSSDRMPGMAAKPSGSTFHADWFGAWDDPTLATWQTNCIDKLLSCHTGNLGNGTGMRWTLPSFKVDPRLVDPPIRVTTAMLCTGKRKLRPAEQEMVRAIRRKLDAARNQDTMLASAKPGRITNPPTGVA